MLDIAARAVRVGVTTDEIDRIVHEVCHLVKFTFFLIRKFPFWPSVKTLLAFSRLQYLS